MPRLARQTVLEHPGDMAQSDRIGDFPEIGDPLARHRGGDQTLGVRGERGVGRRPLGDRERRRWWLGAGGGSGHLGGSALRQGPPWS